MNGYENWHDDPVSVLSNEPTRTVGREYAPCSCMSQKTIVPFGGIRGWLADVTVPRKRPKTGDSVNTYLVAVVSEPRAMAAIRMHANLEDDAVLVPRRAVSIQEVQRLGMRPGQVERA